MHRKNIAIINLPFDLASPRAGACKAPAALENRKLKAVLYGLGYKVFEHSLEEHCLASHRGREIDQHKEVAEFSAMALEKVDLAYTENCFPLVIGGDHSVSIATISGAIRYLKKEKGEEARLGVLWVDAHADLNTTETSPSGNVHGMSVAALLGLGDERLISIGGNGSRLREQDVAFLGLRDLDPGEVNFMKELKLKAISSDEVHSAGIKAAVSSVLQYLEDNVDAFILSFDMDVCDPTIAPGVATPKRGGLTFNEASAVMEMVSKSDKLMALELVELNPELDDSEEKTSRLALELIKTAFG